MTDPLFVCPICKSQARPLDRTGDATGFRCEKHGNFKVAGSVFATPTKDATPEQWEAALKRAKKRTVPGEWPVVTTYDF
jgi:hypothetical protein